MTEPVPAQEAEPAEPAEPGAAARPGPAAPSADALAGWSAAELATLASIAETFVRGGAVRRARLAALAITSLDPAQVRQLRLVLRLVESRLVNLGLFGRPTAFRDLQPDARARYLLGWGTSPLALRRSGYQAFKKLLCFLAYADPGETGANPLWTTIGYRSPIEPLTEEPTPIVPLAVPASAAAVTLEADVVVVGSGAGGGVVAAEAARAGRSVVVVEAGPFIPESEMPTDELTAYDRMYLDHGMTATWDGSVSILAGA
ncbi:MAG TPA: NAD(P)-binding protein, partial [Candidatus Limnocylindrales bacterium]